MLKVYVAAGSSDAARAADIIKRLRAAGVHVTYDWTADVLKEGSAQANLLPRDPRIALAEIRGVGEAEVVWFLVPRIGSSGAGFELGYAYGIGKVLICSGPDRERFYFGVILNEYETDDAALDWLIGIARGRA